MQAHVVEAASPLQAVIQLLDDATRLLPERTATAPGVLREAATVARGDGPEGGATIDPYRMRLPVRSGPSSKSWTLEELGIPQSCPFHP